MITSKNDFVLETSTFTLSDSIGCNFDMRSVLLFDDGSGRTVIVNSERYVNMPDFPGYDQWSCLQQDFLERWYKLQSKKSRSKPYVLFPYVKSKAHVTKPTSLAQLNENICHQIACITQNTCRAVIGNFSAWLNESHEL